MSKKRTILAGDLMRGDSFEHNGLNALVTSVGLTPTHANVKVTIMGQKTTVRFDRDHKVRITPGPPAAKPPLDDSGISEIPVSRFFVRNIEQVRRERTTALGVEPAQDGIVCNLTDPFLEVVFVANGKEMIVTTRNGELEVRSNDGGLQILPYSSNVARIMPLGY